MKLILGLIGIAAVCLALSGELERTKPEILIDMPEAAHAAIDNQDRGE